MFTTLANLKVFLNLTTAADDDLLIRLVADATSLIKTWLSRDVLTATYTQRIDGKGNSEVVLANFPVTAVSVVKVNDMAISPSTGSTDAGYQFDDNSVSLRAYIFTRGKRNVIVTYTAGYATVPADLEQVCIDLCATKYRERDRIGLDSKSLAGETTQFATRDIPNRAKTVLNKYVKVDLA